MNRWTKNSFHPGLKVTLIILLLLGTIRLAIMQPARISTEVDLLQFEYWSRKAAYDSILSVLQPNYEIWRKNELYQPIAETYKFYIASLESKQVENLTDSISAWIDMLEKSSPLPVYLNFFYHLRAERNVRMGNWEEASIALQKIAGSEETATNYPGLAAESLSMLAYLQSEERNFDEALKNTDKADSLLVNNFGENYAGRIMVLNNYGIIYGELGQLEKSLEYALETRKLTQLHYAPEHKNQSISLNNLSVIFNTLGRYNESLEVLKEASAINQKQKREVDLFMNYMNMASSYLSKWDYDNALNYLKLAESMSSENNSNFDPYRIYLYNSLVAYYSDLKDYDSAYTYLKKAIDFGASYYSDYSYPMGGIYFSMGNMEMEKGNFSESIEALEKSIEIYTLYYGEESSKVATSKFFIGIAMEMSGLLYQAVEMVAEAAEIYEKENGFEHRHTIESRIKLAELYAKTGNPDRANLILNTILDRENALNGKEVRTRLIPYEEMVKDVNLIGALELKITLLSKEINETNRAEILKDIARAYEYIGFEFDRISVNFGGFKSRDDLRDRSEMIFKEAVGVCYEIFELTRDPAWADKAFSYSERARASKIREIMRGRIATNHAGLPDSVLNRESQLKSHLKSLENQLTETDVTDTLVYESINKAFLLVNKEYNDFVRKLEKEYPKYFDLKYNVDLATPDDIKENLLREGSALLQYCLLDSAAYVHIIHTDSFYFVKLDIAAGLDEKVKKWYQGMKSRNFQSSDLYGTQIFEEFLKPIYTYVQDKDLIIVPDGALYYINFESLPVSDRNNDYIIQHHKVQYCYSPTVQVQGKSYGLKYNAKYDWVGFVPGFEKDGKREGKEFVAQPWASKAAKYVSDMFKSKLFSGTEANVATFHEYASQGDILHIGTHAVANDEDPLRSYFVLSGQEERYDLLYANEIFNSEIRSKCAVLTACETGMGKIKAGEGMVSLARAFSYAGCPNIILTLWPVDDEQTGTLIEYFYKHVAKGLDMDEALYQAKKNYLDEARGELKHPYYWSGLIYYGSEAGLSQSSVMKKTIVYCIAGAGLLVLVWLLIKRRKPADKGVMKM